LSLADIRELCTRIEDAVTKHLVKDASKHASSVDAVDDWQKMKERLERGVFRKPRIEGSKFWNAVSYALWKKDVLDLWITRLEKTLDAIDKSLDKAYHSQTADQFSS
jgi:hypothetical protein